DTAMLWGLVNDCNNAIEKCGGKDDTLSQDILNREAALRNRIFVDESVKEPFAIAYEKWPSPFDGILRATADALDPIEYAIRDARACKLALLVEFITLNSSPNAPDLTKVIEALRCEEWNAIDQAQLLVYGAIDGATAGDLEDALDRSAVEIVVSHDTPDA